MRTLFGMILGALLLVGGVYVYDSMQTSSVAKLVVPTQVSAKVMLPGVVIRGRGTRQ